MYDFQPIIDLSDTARGSGDAFCSASGLSVFNRAVECDHAVLHSDFRADDALRDIPGFDPGQNRQVARRHCAFFGVKAAVCINRDVINDACYAFSVCGYALGLLLIGLSPDYAAQSDHAAARIHVDIDRVVLIAYRQFALHSGGDGGIRDVPSFATRDHQREEGAQDDQQNPLWFQASLFIHDDPFQAGSNQGVGRERFERRWREGRFARALRAF
jgi:hypothetical protein